MLFIRFESLFVSNQFYFKTSKCLLDVRINNLVRYNLCMHIPGTHLVNNHVDLTD